MESRLKMQSRANLPKNLYIPIRIIHGNEMSAKTTRHIYPIDLSPCKSELEMIVGKLKISKAEAVREAIRHFHEYARGLEVIKYRNLSRRQAKAEVQKYLKGKDRVSADDISDALRIAISLVNEILMELWRGGWVEPYGRGH